MTRTALDWLRDARAYARAALDNGGGLDAEALAAATQPLHAVLFDLVIVGEALGKMSSDVQSLASDIPWRMTKEIRNLIVHAYWQIDFEIVSNVVEHEIEPLVESLNRLIARLADQPS